MKNYIFVFSLFTAIIIGIISSCSKSNNNKVIVPASTAVSIKNFAFSPASISIKTGASVTWTNVDASAHTVTDLNGSFDSKAIATNATFEHTFSTPGTYTYHCTFHAMMASATVIVSN